MAMLDTGTGKVLATVPIGGAWMAAHSMIRCNSCSHRAVKHDDHREEETPDKLSVVQTLKIERGARTMALDPKTHRIICPPHNSNRRRRFAWRVAARPKIIPNTLKLLGLRTGANRPSLSNGNDSNLRVLTNRSIMFGCSRSASIARPRKAARR